MRLATLQFERKLQKGIRMGITKGFAWNRKYVLLGAKQPGCVVSVFSDTSNVRVGLLLAHADNFLPVWHYLLINIGTFGTNSPPSIAEYFL